jgi:hypothetical protein
MTKQGRRPGAWLTALVGAAIAAPVLAGCGEPAAPLVADPTYIGVCVDPLTGWRAPDWECGGAVSALGLAADLDGYYWDYYTPGYAGSVIAVGRPMPRGVTFVRTLPTTTVIVVDRGVSSGGGSASMLRTRAVQSGSARTVAARPAAPKVAPKPGSPVVRGGFGGGGAASKPAAGSAGS